MSKDIRSFFQVKKTQKPRVEEDDDVIPESPDVQIKNKKKDTKKKRVIKDSDSEEEIFSKKKKHEDKSTKHAPKTAKPALREVKAVDIFGSGPIKRTEPLVKKQKKTETGIHSDDEFEKSLLEIDNSELEAKIEKTNDEKSNSKNEQPSTDLKINGTANKDKKLPSINDIPSTSEVKTKKDKATDKKHDTNTTDTKKVIKDEKRHKINDTDTKDAKTDEKKHRSHDRDSKDIKKDIKDERKHKSNTDSKDMKKDVKDERKSKDTKLGIKEQVKLDNKRKFSEFVEKDNGNENGSGKKKKLDEEGKSKSIDDQSGMNYDDDMTIVEDHDKGRNKKNSFNKTLNESVLTDEERHERRRHSAALYKNYLNRSGPKHLGAKEIPEGSPNCLKDRAFVLTGVLDSFEKDEIGAVITQYGGAVKSGVSKKVTHVLAGDDAGPAKIAKAKELGIKIINEDEFLKMIVNLSNKSNEKHDKEVKKDKSLDRKSSKDKISPKDKSEKHNHVDNHKKSTKSPEKNRSESKLTNSKNKMDTSETKSRGKSRSPRKIKEEIKTEVIDTKVEAESSSKGISVTTRDHDKKYSYMWVDKYKPQNVKQIIGQHGDASNVKKLTNWLMKWYVNRKAKLSKPSPWAKGDDGGYFKAVLLSGPPGVGKTTTVSLVCKELGFDTVEFNASDTRNKTLIKEQIGELLTSTSLSGYARGDTGKQAVTKKHVLVMDEVDGMAGNEDRGELLLDKATFKLDGVSNRTTSQFACIKRNSLDNAMTGGLQELIGLIKNTSVPIICMCNDRNSQKMRSLVNYCYDLRFSRPRVDQIKSAMMSICFKEGIKIPPDVLSQLIVSANQDVRQTLNLLSLWAADGDAGTDLDVDKLRRDAKGIKKDIKLGPWEAIRKVFSAEDHKTMSINDKSDLFFYDYSLAPLFVQENYLQVAPHCPKHEVLQRISRAADSISLGDVVSARIRGSQAWNLLPSQAMYSSVIPGHELSGHVAGQVQFPAWLGRNSRATKLQRLCQEIHAHTRLSTSGSKSSIYLDYCTHLRDAIVTPLVKERTDGIPQSLGVLEAYHLLREDLDSLVELSVWPGQRNPTVLIDAKVKAAMTRTYNKKATALPYAPGAVKKGRAREHDDEQGDEGEGEGQGEEEPEDSDPENDALIKKKKDKEAEKPSTSKSKSSVKPSTSKEKKKK